VPANGACLINREMDLIIPRTSAKHARCVARSAPWNAATVSVMTQLRVSSTRAWRSPNPRRVIQRYSWRDGCSVL